MAAVRSALAALRKLVAGSKQVPPPRAAAPTRSPSAGLAQVVAIVTLIGAGAAACDQKKPLTVTGLKPRVGPYTGGDPVFIDGSGFQSEGAKGFKVYFGKNEARNAILLSDTQMRVEPPAGAIGETVDVDVIFDDSRSGKLPKSYTYIDPLGEQAPAPAGEGEPAGATP